MTEITLMGTFHFPDRFEIFSGEAQKEIQKICDRIAAWKPDKIAVELPMREQAAVDLYYREFDPAVREDQRLGTMKRYGKVVEDTYRNEAFQIGFRTAKQLGLPKVYGIDEDMEIPDEIAEPVVSQVADELKELQTFLQSHAGTLTEQLLLHNSQEYIRRNTLLYVKANKVNFGKYEGSMFNAIWCERNLKIFSNLQNICRDCQKVFLLIGSDHQKILSELIGSDADLKLRRLE